MHRRSGTERTESKKSERGREGGRERRERRRVRPLHFCGIREKSARGGERREGTTCKRGGGGGRKGFWGWGGGRPHRTCSSKGPHDDSTHSPTQPGPAGCGSLRAAGAAPPERPRRAGGSDGAGRGGAGLSPASTRRARTWRSSSPWTSTASRQTPHIRTPPRPIRPQHMRTRGPARHGAPAASHARRRALGSPPGGSFSFPCRLPLSSLRAFVCLIFAKKEISLFPSPAPALPFLYIHFCILSCGSSPLERTALCPAATVDARDAPMRSPVCCAGDENRLPCCVKFCLQGCSAGNQLIRTNSKRPSRVRGPGRPDIRGALQRGGRV